MLLEAAELLPESVEELLLEPAEELLLELAAALLLEPAEELLLEADRANAAPTPRAWQLNFPTPC